MKTIRFLVILTATILFGSSLIGAHEQTWFPAKVIRISEEYANINTDITEPQLAEHGITQGTKFRAMFENHTMVVLLGKTYGDVKKGEWIALIEEDGKLQLAISYGHAATEIDCKKGDTMYIESQTRTD